MFWSQKCSSYLSLVGEKEDVVRIAPLCYQVTQDVAFAGRTTAQKKANKQVKEFGEPAAYITVSFQYKPGNVLMVPRFLSIFRGRNSLTYLALNSNIPLMCYTTGV